MKYKVTYYVNCLSFVRKCSSISEAYEAIKAIVITNKIVFSNVNETLSEYMTLLVDMESGNRTFFKNFYFLVETIGG